MKICPTRPTGLIAWALVRSTTRPPMFTAVTRSKLGVAAPFFALLERSDQIWPLFAFTPPIKRLPSASTSGVPHFGEFGRKIGFIQVDPPSIERLNCLPP